MLSGIKNQVKVESFDGITYKFMIIMGTTGRRRIFSICAIDKETGHFSSVNNLNTIISLFEVDSEKARYEDSSWNLSSKECEKFRIIAMDAIKDNHFKHYLEEKLDADRNCGEWENIVN